MSTFFIDSLCRFLRHLHNFYDTFRWTFTKLLDFNSNILKLYLLSQLFQSQPNAISKNLPRSNLSPRVSILSAGNKFRNSPHTNNFHNVSSPYYFLLSDPTLNGNMCGLQMLSCKFGCNVKFINLWWFSIADTCEQNLSSMALMQTTMSRRCYSVAVFSDKFPWKFMLASTRTSDKSLRHFPWKYQFFSVRRLFLAEIFSLPPTVVGINYKRWRQISLTWHFINLHSLSNNR
jgi:hypothetical protein